MPGSYPGDAVQIGHPLRVGTLDPERTKYIADSLSPA
jgi:hypothetical protein